MNSNPKPRTQAQIEAARLNGAKSRGPATPEGKSISSQNALRHGLLSKMVVIEGESETSFHDLAASLRQSFAPPDGLDFDEHENILLDTMVLSAWRRLRAVAMESAALTLELKSQQENYPDDPSTACPESATATATFHAFTSLTANTPSFDLILRYETRHTRAYERAAKALRDHRAARLAARQAASQAATESESIPEFQTNQTPPTPAPAPVPIPAPSQPNEPTPAYAPPHNKRPAQLLRQAKRRKNRPSASPRP